MELANTSSDKLYFTVVRSHRTRIYYIFICACACDWIWTYWLHTTLLITCRPSNLYVRTRRNRDLYKSSVRSHYRRFIIVHTLHCRLIRPIVRSPVYGFDGNLRSRGRPPSRSMETTERTTDFEDDASLYPSTAMFWIRSCCLRLEKVKADYIVMSFGCSYATR